MKIGIRLFVCALLALIMLFSVCSVAVFGRDLRYEKSNAEQSVLYADELFDLLFSDETSLSEFERSYLRSQETLALTYSSDLSSNLVVWNYNGEAGTLTVEASAFRYTAKNGEEVAWIPQTVSAQDAVAHPLTQSGSTYCYTYTGVWNSGSMELTVEYAWTVVLSAQTADAILTGAFPEAKAISDRLENFEINHAEWEEMKALYNAYCEKLESYNKEYRRWELKKQNYDAYLVNLSNYNASVEEYQALSQAWEAYNEYRRQLSAYNSALAQYNAYAAVMQEVESRLAVMELMFTPTSDGNEWCFYPSLMGESVDAVLERRYELHTFAGIPEITLDKAKEATDTVRPLLTRYAEARDREYDSEFEKIKELFTIYTDIYADLTQYLGLLHDRMVDIYGYGPLQREMDTNAQTKEKMPHFRQFLLQMYVLQALLDDFETMDILHALPTKKADKIVRDLVEPALRPVDTNNADPVGIVFPEEHIQEPVAPEAVEKPEKEMPADPTLYGPPELVEDPGDPPAAPEPVADPGIEPIPEELTAAEQILLDQYHAGTLFERAARNTAQTLTLTRSISKTASYQNKRTVVFYRSDGSKLEERTLEYGSPIADLPQLADYRTEQYSYTFAGWEDETHNLLAEGTAITENTAYTAVFLQTVNTFTVTWKHESGTILETDQNVPYGNMPAYNGATPAKAATAQYTYAFAGWNKTLAPVTGDVTYTATFTQTLNTYTVTWKHENGTVLETDQNVPYGAAPAYNGATPAKAATAQYTYTFAGWNKTLASVTGDVTYTATFTQTLNTYTVTWKHENGNVLELDEQVAYGATPVYNGATPTKAATAQYTYTFAGWNKALASVTGDVTYTATFAQTLNTYTVLWKDHDGSVLKTDEQVAYGATPSFGAAPTRPNSADGQFSYTFDGWSPAIETVTGDVTYTARWKAVVRTYTVTWVLNNGEQSRNETYSYGQTPQYNGTLTKAADTEYSYVFNGWSPAIETVTGDATYTAQWKATLNVYTVVWDLGNGNSTTVQAEYGQIPQYPGTPTRPNSADGQFSYTFAGWSPAIETVTGDVTYTAQWNAIVNQYTVTWELGNGSEPLAELLDYGAIPSHADPTRQETPQYTYVFAGWDQEIAAVTGNVTYTAIWNPILRFYTITWELGYCDPISEQLAYGATPVYEDPARPNSADGQFSYAFAGWSPAVETVTGDQTYTAQWNAAKRSYTVVWDFGYGGKTSAVVMEYGAMPAYEDPARPNSENGQFSYTFAGWDQEIAAVTGDVTYTAQWNATVNQYTVIWNLGDGSDPVSVTLDFGMPLQYEGTPVREQDARFTYAFAGWEDEAQQPLAENATVTGDQTYTAKWTPTPRSYTVTWDLGYGGKTKTTTATYGELPHYAGTPTRKPDGQNTYTFIGWSPEVSVVTEDTTYTARWQSDLRPYTVIWDLGNGETVVASASYGELPVFNGTPEKAQDERNSYLFVGWSPAVTAVTEDVTYIAQWQVTPRLYTVTWDLQNGTPAVTTTVTYGETPAFAQTPVRESDDTCFYVFTGWSPAIGAVTEDVTYTAGWQANPHSFTVIWDLGTGETVSTQVPNSELPAFAGTPERENDDTCSYTFIGWSPAIVAATANTTYTAIWQKSPLVHDAEGNSYVTETTEQAVLVEVNQDELDLKNAIDFAAEDGKTVSLQREGATVSLNAETVKEQYPEVSGVRWAEKGTENRSARSFRIDFVDSEGNALQSGPTYQVALPYAEGQILTVYEEDGNTLREITAYHSVSTTGRLATFSIQAGKTVVCKVRYTLRYESDREYYTTLPAYAESGELVSIAVECDYGYEMTGATLIHENGEQTEVGTSFEMPAESLTVKLHIVPIVYHVTFLCGDDILSERDYAFGETIELPEDPSLPDEGDKRYLFRGWTPQVSETATGEEREPVYRAVFSVGSNLPEEETGLSSWLIFVSPFALSMMAVLAAVTVTVVLIVILKRKSIAKKRKRESIRQEGEEPDQK